MRKLTAILLTLFLLAAVTACGDAPNDDEGGTPVDSYFTYPQKTDVIADRQYNLDAPVLFPEELWQVPQAIRYEEGDVGAVQAYFLDSVQGTKVFAYVGIPETASASAKAPGIVLVHGGGGTAFYEWVDYWVKRGYAAIAMDTEGNMPCATSNMGNNDHVKSIYPSGPANQAFADKYAAVESQWVYHALASIIVSNSFLGSFPEVDSARIGITGISYGGFLTCNAVGYDDRFAFACPVYGCVGNKGTDTAFGQLTKNSATDIWDDCSILEASRTPILFINGNRDQHFSTVATSACFRASRYAELAFISDFPHSHYHGATEVPQLNLFADHVTYGKKGLPRITVQPHAEHEVVQLELPANVNVYEAELMVTSETELSSTTAWTSRKASVQGKELTASVPENATAWYFNVIDDRGMQISTALVRRTD